MGLKDVVRLQTFDSICGEAVRSSACCQLALVLDAISLLAASSLADVRKLAACATLRGLRNRDDYPTIFLVVLVFLLFHLLDGLVAAARYENPFVGSPSAPITNRK